jgi:glycosyltransferase involved in cell wall biosynthesis
MRVPVSVLIPVKNEAAHMAGCIDSVQWAGEIVVVDSGSTDGTLDIASILGAKIVQFHYQPGGPKKKNWALESYPFRHDWILILDADERIAPELAREIASVIAAGTEHIGFYINRRNYFAGKWIRHAGYYPSWNLRLLKRGRARYELLPETNAGSGDNEVHEHVIVEGSIGRLEHPMEHFAYQDVAQFVEKHNRYSNWEATLGSRLFAKLENESACQEIDGALNRKRKLKRLARQFPFPHWLRFAYHYFLKRGFLDGVEGYVFCHLLAEYEFWIWAKTRLATRTGEAQPATLKAGAAPWPGSWQ